MGIAALPAGHVRPGAGRVRPVRSARQPGLLAGPTAGQPAQRGAPAHRRRARGPAGAGTYPLSGGPAGAAGHAGHIPWHGGDAARHRAGAGKRHRPGRHPRVAGRARQGPGICVRHIDRRGRHVRHAGAAGGPVPARTGAGGAASGQQGGKHVARVHAELPARGIVQAAPAPGRSHATPGRGHAEAGRSVAGHDEEHGTAEPDAERPATGQPGRVPGQGRGGVRPPGVRHGTVHEGKRGAKRALGRRGAAARRAGNDVQPVARDGQFAGHRDAGGAPATRRPDRGLAGHDHQRSGHLE
ncbi:hypothetical protein D3C85_743020 [compost metagenome]